MRHALLPLTVLALLATGCGENSLLSGEGQEIPLARGIDVERITINQGVEIPLMANEGPVTERNASVVTGRPGLIRAYVDLRDAWTAREVVAELTIENGEDVQVMEHTRYVGDASTEWDLDSTFNFDVLGEDITTATRFSIAVREIDKKVEAEGSDADAQWPAEGTAELLAAPGATLEIVLIPIRYRADGSNRLPDTSEAQVARYQEMAYAMYPAQDVVVSVGPTLDWNQSVSPMDSNSWGQLLYAVMGRRNSAPGSNNVYYYGVFNAAPSINQWCGQGCILGLSTVGSEADVWSRASIGIGFSGDTAVETMVHEVGHAHGREHAPCGLYGQASDRSWPGGVAYDDASIGVWGYDLLDGSLLDPTQTVDMMSYCSPIWVSDYTYEALFDRITALHSQDVARSANQPTQRWQVLHVDGSGEALWGDVLDLTDAPSGQRRDVALHAASGLVIDEIPGHYYPFSHGEGGFVLIPEQIKDVRAATLR